MASNEQPPVPQQERQPRPAEQPSSSTVQKTLSELITDVIARNGTIDDIKHSQNGGEEEIRRVHEKKKQLGKDVRIILTQIQRGLPQEQIPLSPVAIGIIKEIDASKIGSDSAPVVYELLRFASSREPSHDLGTMDGMNGAIQAVLDVANLETKTSQNILKKMVEYADSKGWAGAPLESARGYLKPRSYTKEQLNKMRKERNSIYDDIFGPIKNVTLPEAAKAKLRAKLEAETKEAMGEGGLSPEKFEQGYQETIKMETERMQDEISGLLNSVISAGSSPKDQALALQKYNSALKGFLSKGFMSPEDFDMLKELPDSPLVEEYFSSETRRSEGSDIVAEASRVFVPTQEQVRLLRAISSAESLKSYFYSEVDRTSGQLRYLKNDKVEWKVFYEDMKGIFEELLSIADRNPNQFFEQAFNPMYEGHLYQLLLKRLTHLGSQIAVNENEWFEDQKIEVQQPIEDPNPSNSEAPYKPLLQTKTTKVSLGVAIGNYFANNMTDLLHVREHLHNVSAICNQGLGWEQLSQYSERMSLSKFDWIVRQESDLSLAYNLYMTNLQQELSANRGVVSTQFGRADEVWQLNSVELKAFLQLKAHLALQHPELAANESALNQKAIQKVRMASAIASGITGEFWNSLLTGRMPINTEKGPDGEGDIVDKTANVYTGTHHRGYEKMIGQLDLDMVLERFGLPKYYNAIRYTPRYRNMKHPPGAYSKEGYFDHSIVYRAKFLNEDANQNGRSDELADFDETYVTFTDYMRTKCVGLFARGGWRFAQWEAFKVYKGEDLKKMDYAKTLNNVRQAGSYIVKQFIDSVSSPGTINGLSQEEVELLSGISGVRGDQLSSEQKANFKKTLYTNLLFNQIKRTAPTKFLQFESRRWTPRGERLLRNDLTDYLKGQLPGYRSGVLETHIYTMYVSALSLVEKSTWAKNKESKETINYEIGDSDINAHRKELEAFFENYKANLGEYDSFGKQVLISESFDQFLSTLKGCQTKLRKSIEQTRHSRENGGGKVETLAERFAERLMPDENGSTGSSKGDIENLIGGDDLDLTKFYFSGTGGFSTTRMMGETFGVTGKMNTALMKLINEALPKFVRGQYKDIHELEKAVTENFLPLFKEIQGPIAIMDKNQADEYMISLALFVSNMVGKDRIMRIKGIGPAIDFWRRQRYGTTQSSVMQDFFRNDLKNPSTSLDSDEIYAFGHILLNGCGVPPHEEIPDHYETVLSIGGRPIITRRVNAGVSYEKTKLWGPFTYMKKVVDHSKQQKFSQEDFEKSAGIEGGVKWLETYAPAIAGALVAILLAMAYLANQKNKKK